MKTIAIIGSGIGGLTVGNLLVRKGHNVTLFESHGTPGGYTSGFWRKGFYFESGTLTFESSRTVFSALKDLGVYDRLTFEKYSCRFLSQNYDSTPGSYEGFKKLLYTTYPHYKDNLDRCFRDVDTLYHTATTLLGESSVLAKLPAAMRLTLKTMKYRRHTIGQFAAQYFPKSSPLYQLLSGIAYPDMPALFLGGTLYYLLHDYWTVKEGMQSLADALADNFRNAGGQLRFNSPVERIIVRNGKAEGVHYRGGDQAADSVIAAMDYKTVFLKLIDKGNIPSRLRDRIRRAEVSESSVAIYLALSLSNEELLKRMEKSYIICPPEQSDSGQADDSAYFKYAPFSLCSPSLKNPALAPAGKSSLMISALVPHQWMNNWGNGDHAIYEQLKWQVAETLIQRAAAVIPGLLESIELKDAATPLTFERYTGNTGGATSAWSWNPHKRFYRNMVALNIRTPVKNLYISSSWSRQFGGGVPGAISAAYKCAELAG